MSDEIEIRGGAGEFEAAVIAAVVDRIAAEERRAREGWGRSRRLPAWVRALRPDESGATPDLLRPDPR